MKSLSLQMRTNTLAIVLVGLFLPCAIGAQTGRVRVEENIRAAPNGVLLGRLAAGTLLRADRIDGDWVQFTLEAWVWIQSLRVIDRGGFDLVVSAAGGENLRDGPSGSILGRFEDGTLLEEIERAPGWARVRRTMWIWSESVELESSPGTPAPEVEEAPAPAARFRIVGSGGLAVLTAPDGDTLVRVPPGSALEVLARQGSWARVRMEGWAWLPVTADGEDTESPLVVEVTPGEAAASPATFRGRIVEWDLQFISLERAEKIRTDFYEGEPFLLTRTTGADAAIFVYVAVPPERLSEMERLTPLERIRVLGRIRVGAASLTGSPIVDLLELRSGGIP